MPGISVLQTTARLRKFQTSAKKSGQVKQMGAVGSSPRCSAVGWGVLGFFFPHLVSSLGTGAFWQQHWAQQHLVPPAALGTQHPAGSTGHRRVPAAWSVLPVAASSQNVLLRGCSLQAQCTLMEYFGNFRNWRSLSFRLCFRAISALVFSSTSWSGSRMILALSSAFLSPECLKSFCSDSSSMLSKMLATAFLRRAVSKR